MLKVFAGLIALTAIGVVAFLSVLAFGSGQSTGSALADAEANFRSSLQPGQVVHSITERYRRQPPLGEQVPTDITISTGMWTDDVYTELGADGSVDREVAFQPSADGAPRKVRSVDGRMQTTYDAAGDVALQVTLPSNLPFDMGYSTWTKFINEQFPSDLTVEGEGSGVAVFLGEVDDPLADDGLSGQSELSGLAPVKMIIRYEIDETTGLLALFQEVAIDADGKTTLVIEDRVTAVEVIPAPSFFSEQF